MPVAQPEADCAPASSRAVWSAPSAKEGASLTGVIVIVKVCAALVSTPPLAVPPLSLARTVTVAVPRALAARGSAGLPFGETAGWEVNRALLLLVTRNETAWPDSSAGPAVMAVAQPEADCAPPS